MPRESFALDPACRDGTTLFEVNIVLGRSATRYTSGFELSGERVEAEWLHAYPNGRRQVWFDREAGLVHRQLPRWRAGDDVASCSASTRDMLLDTMNGPRYVEQAERLLRTAGLGVVRLDIDAERPKDQRVRLPHSGSGRKPVPLDFTR